MSSPAQDTPHTPTALKALVIGAIGVVYGDIGTSPLYAFKEAFNPAHGLILNDIHILNMLSLIFWSLMIVVSFKYVVLMMMVDNKGEGGSLALLALANRISHESKWLPIVIPVLGIFAAALFYGDSIITPAISVLSAVEGIRIVAPTLDKYIIPVTLFLLVMLFAIQKYGTGSVGKLFGPVTMIWFLALGVLGVVNIMKNPGVLVALNPMYAIEFMLIDKWIAFLTLGTVVLALTGAEALYADMGHFGKKPIRIAWAGLVGPALVLNYFGQGAYVMLNPDGIENPLFRMAPDWFEWPLLFLATCATIIASQAVITGAFSMTRGAIQLGYLPRMSIIHTSVKEMGQIYLPFINWVLLFFVILLVLGFQTSSNLASAYGVAVTGTMLITSLVVGVVVFRLWKWNPLWAVPLIGGLILIDLAFFLSTATKITHGGWFPLVFGLMVFLLLTTWKRGRELLFRQLRKDIMPVDVFFRETCEKTLRVPGTAIFMSNIDDGIPNPLLHNLKHNKILHERVLIVHVVVEERPFVKTEKRYNITDLGQGFFRVTMHYGFKDDIRVAEELVNNDAHGFNLELDKISFFIGRETIIPSKLPGMALWREYLFAWMSRNASSAADFYQLPSKRVMELGSRIDI